MSTSVANFVRSARENANMTQRELEALVNKQFGKGTITRSKIAHIELGSVNPTVDAVSAITTAIYNKDAN